MVEFREKIESLRPLVHKLLFDERLKRYDRDNPDEEITEGDKEIISTIMNYKGVKNDMHHIYVTHEVFLEYIKRARDVLSKYDKNEVMPIIRYIDAYERGVDERILMLIRKDDLNTVDIIKYTLFLVRTMKAINRKMLAKGININN